MSKYGQGTGAAFAPDECVDICECLVKRVDGKWRVVEEWGDRSTLAFERVLRQAAPFRTDLEALPVPDCAPEPEPAESDGE